MPVRIDRGRQQKIKLYTYIYCISYWYKIHIHIQIHPHALPRKRTRRNTTTKKVFFIHSQHTQTQHQNLAIVHAQPFAPSRKTVPQMTVTASATASAIATGKWARGPQSVHVTQAACLHNTTCSKDWTAAGTCTPPSNLQQQAEKKKTNANKWLKKGCHKEQKSKKENREAVTSDFKIFSTRRWPSYNCVILRT